MRTSKRPPGGAGCQRRADQPGSRRRQTGVGMQEEQHLAPAGSSTGVHLRRPAAHRVEYPVRQCAREPRGAVGTAAVDHQQFRPLPPQRSQLAQLRRDRRRFVEHRHDHRQPRLRLRVIADGGEAVCSALSAVFGTGGQVIDASSIGRILTQRRPAGRRRPSRQRDAAATGSPAASPTTGAAALPPAATTASAQRQGTRRDISPLRAAVLQGIVRPVVRRPLPDESVPPPIAAMPNDEFPDLPSAGLPDAAGIPFAVPGAERVPDDAFGPCLTLAIGNAWQSFRWIPPGRFLMGSPVDEAERGSAEVPHEVTLSRGFWLADTACTQALWMAVWPVNPSHFADDARNPVENVAWHDAQRFIGELNRRLPACRRACPPRRNGSMPAAPGRRRRFPSARRFRPTR
jgi:hypothetical protein